MIASRRGRLGALKLSVCMVAVLAAGCANTSSKAGTPLPTDVPASPTTSSPSPPAPARRAPDHVVVVIFENKGAEQIIGSGQAPTFDAMAKSGALHTRSYAVTHPSQPNYLALFSGSTQGITDDSCPHTFRTGNIAEQLIGAGLTFTGYAEALPHSGFTGCSQGDYARKHAPWTDFADLAPSVSQPYSSFPADFTQLPSVAFVVPDMCHDMHNCPIGAGDRWLKQHMSAYASWAQTHHSVLIITFDEDDSNGANVVSTIVLGQGIAPARISSQIDHYTVLRTLEACFGLPPLGAAALRTPLAEVCG